ncbi:MAG: hypothetical protein ACYCV0_08390 [Desulfitobacteriaceae bacterium]
MRIPFPFLLMLVIDTTGQFYSQFVVFFQIFEVIQLLYTIGLSLNGFIVTFLSYVHDNLVFNNVIWSNMGETMDIGIIIMMFLQTLVQSKRFTDAYDENKVLLEKLKVMDKLKDEFLANTSHELDGNPRKLHIQGQLSGSG